MAFASVKGARVAAIGTCVPQRRYDNVEDTKQFSKEEVKKVVALAGVKSRRLADDSICSSDLCLASANAILESLRWEKDSIDALIMVTPRARTSHARSQSFSASQTFRMAESIGMLFLVARSLQRTKRQTALPMET